MRISIIAAMTKTGVIGQDNKLPWRIPAELQHFKEVTMGKPMIMGRATFDSIGKRLLPGRRTIILTRDLDMPTGGYIVASSIDTALQAAGDVAEVMIVGGASIYRQFLSRADRMYLSIIHHDYSGNIFFPEYDVNRWCLISETINPEFTVQILDKIT